MVVSGQVRGNSKFLNKYIAEHFLFWQFSFLVVLSFYENIYAKNIVSPVINILQLYK